ncbi:hypothetical protein LV457_16230 [Mycobacterium sp. MYCO198283]|uniref:hypothetical protein n=1 Tax=Mycobacterium sp. MYCO198283 TaxID=2883505 RepID=UPI001E491D5D|nr:hypothetical protein [Mycobacterium sp. MYCO198283]MCG5433824.1 hypothetical protein [Mycobacterium sp. MYCO198283]
MNGDRGRLLRVQVLVAFMCLALVFYLAVVGRIGWRLLTSGDTVAALLGVGLLILPLIGLYALVSTLRAGLAHQRLARIVHAEGMELDVSGLPRRPSGRIEREAADALFDQVRAELEADPDNWRRWYRLARAYDYAGDRSRAREAMGKAVAMEGTSR